ncbi:MAG TPA: BREX system ATP-binding domain-containing protein [Actinomycetota bacterium]|nr:BREX system ATP-binding domain-containing protein [Actinomycetota bacterium]
MTAAIGLESYLEFLSKEYLGDFIRQGGASVKFLVNSDPKATDRVHAGLADTAAADGYVYARIEGSVTKVHQIDQVFFAVARQVDWVALAARFVRSAYEAVSFPVPDEPGELRIAAAATRHGVDHRELYRSVRRHLEAQVLGDHAMVHEFRLAMLRICQAQLDAGDIDDAERDAVLDWLRGDLRQVSRVRSSLIYTRVARHNARHLLLSTAHWLVRTGHSGLLLDLDIGRLLVSRRPPVEEREGLYYSKAMVIDAYEVLRQLVDATDDLSATLVAVSAPLDFVTDETRGLTSYTALQLRVADEVRDRRRSNPYAALVRVSTTP